MKKKQFKTESKKVLDLMINSIYTNKEIFLRELISNSSDALDKLYYTSLTNSDIKVKKKDLKIVIEVDKDKRIITLSDNGIGMSKEELEDNLGTIAKSGSELFKENLDTKNKVNIIGQFGVGFYSSFIVSNKVEVMSKKADQDKAYKWISSGVDGYSIEECDKKETGTTIILHLKDNTENENYDEFLEYYTITNIVKKYSDYVNYPIILIEKTQEDGKEKVEEKQLNSMIPIWKKDKNKVKEEEYNAFYIDKFDDYENPLKCIRYNAEGKCEYQSLMFIPSHAPYDFYTKEYKKGLKLYSKGILIMDKCEDLLPDYYSFVKGIVDSEDLSLNISRETLQQNHQIKTIAKSLESKITKELKALLKDDRENYEKFFTNFGTGLKYGIYSSYGMHKDILQDLILFYSSKDKKYTSLKEYVERMKEDQDKIYYACGDSLDSIELLPQVESVKDKGYEILYLIDYVDEFTLKMLGNYQDKEFISVSDEKLDLSTSEEKELLNKENKEYENVFQDMKKILNNEVNDIKFTNNLKNHPVCLVSEGQLSVGMEKVLNSMPDNNEKIKATTILEINNNHPIKDKIKNLHDNKEKDELEKITKVLYAQAKLIEGLKIENPAEITNLICDIISK